MPTYSYLCDACGSEFEKEQRISEAPIKKCPKCGKQKARRMINGGNFILKGGGWYSDGYGSTNKSSSGGKSSGKASETSSEPSTAPASTSSSSDTKAPSSTPASSDD